MAKVGTAHVEIKPVLNEDALDEIVARIEAAVKAGVEAGIAAARPIYGDVHITAHSGNADALIADSQRLARQRATSGVPRERRERGRGNQ